MSTKLNSLAYRKNIEEIAQGLFNKDKLISLNNLAIRIKIETGYRISNGTLSSVYRKLREVNSICRQ